MANDFQFLYFAQSLSLQKRKMLLEMELCVCECRKLHMAKKKIMFKLLKKEKFFFLLL